MPFGSYTHLHSSTWPFPASVPRSIFAFPVDSWRLGSRKFCYYQKVRRLTPHRTKLAYGIRFRRMALSCGVKKSRHWFENAFIHTASSWQTQISWWNQMQFKSINRNCVCLDGQARQTDSWLFDLRQKSLSFFKVNTKKSSNLSIFQANHSPLITSCSIFFASIQTEHFLQNIHFSQKISFFFSAHGTIHQVSIKIKSTGTQKMKAITQTSEFVLYFSFFYDFSLSAVSIRSRSVQKFY